jgi:Flp pilus assembly protein TadG
MLPPLIHKSLSQSSRERGVTMVLVAVAMVAIIAMAALSIDIIALYLDREEAQRSADTAALAAARVLSLSGVTGDPNNTQGGLPSPPWPAACALATQLAQAIANQNSVGSAVANTVSVTFSYNGTTTDCSNGNAGFGINPQVQVQITRQGLPTMFSRIWSRSTNTVRATATAEAFNPSNSGTVGTNVLVAVNPRCVKPWIIPNQDPGNGNNPFVALGDGSIQNPGIRLNGAPPGVVGETLLLTDACTIPNCDNMKGGTPLAGQYVGALVASGAAVAVPTCANDSPYQEAIGGCDQNTTYACGSRNGAQADLSINPAGDTYAATQCLIHQSGQDFIDTSLFPYQIHAGSANPVVNSGIITSSASIVSIPIYDQTQGTGTLVGNSPQVTIVGFLQAFITQANSNGSLNLTVLNVSGCSNAATANPVSGTSPVPTRLITP